MRHTEFGQQLLEKLATDLSDIGTVEVMSKLDGRNMTMMFAPAKKKVS
jgi:translation initiation factor IF-3